MTVLAKDRTDAAIACFCMGIDGVGVLMALERMERAGADAWWAAEVSCLTAETKPSDSQGHGGMPWTSNS